MKLESKKQCMDTESMRVRMSEVGIRSESMRVRMSEVGIRSEVSCNVRELGPERVDALSLNSTSALMVSTQSSVGAESRGLPSDFLTLRQILHRKPLCRGDSCPWMYLLPGLWQQRMWPWSILWPCVRFFRKRDRDVVQNVVCILCWWACRLCRV